MRSTRRWPLPTLLVVDCPGSDPGAQSLLDAVRDRLPVGWQPVSAPRLARAWRALVATDALLFAGGDLSGPRVGAALALALSAQARRERVVMLGVGVERLRVRLSRQAARALARRADLLVLRDGESARALVAAGVPAPLRVGADPAWAALGAPRQGVERNDRVVAAIGPGERAPGLEEGLRRLAAEGLTVALQPWETTRGDAFRRCDRLIERLGQQSELLDPLHDLSQARRRFAGARLAVAGPVHALMAAAAAGTPFVAAGQDAAHVALTKRFAQLPPAGDLPGALVAALVRPAPDAATVRAEFEAAEGEFRLLRLLLSGGDSGGDAGLGHGTRLEPEPGAS